MQLYKSFLMLCIIPLIAFVVALLGISDINKRLNDEFLLKDISISITEICEIDEIGIQDLCNDTYLEYELLKTWSIYVACGSLFLLLIIYFSSIYCSDDRDKLATIFPKLMPLLLLSLLTILFIEGCLITYSTYLIQIIILEAWFPWITGLVGIGALLGIKNIFVSVWSSLKNSEHVILNGKKINVDMAPGLFSLIENVSAQLNAKMPNNVVLGLEPNFYAISAPTKLSFQNERITGDTLYLSLPLLRVLSSDELKAIIGHELGHFIGADTKYTEKFVPALHSVQTSIISLENEKHLVLLPTLATLYSIINLFERNIKKVSRLRENIADEISAKVVGPKFLIQSLLKFSIYNHAWNYVYRKTIDRIRNGYGITKNLPWLFQSVVKHNISLDTMKLSITEASNNPVSHPFDTHPTTLERATFLNVDICSIDEASFLLPIESAEALIINVKEIEEELTSLEQMYLDALGVRAGEADGNVLLQKIISMFAAFITVADGKVETREVEAAESIGCALFETFDYFDFREYCHYPTSLPDLDKLIDYTKGYSFQVRSTIVRMCTDIANADSDFSSEESEFIAKIKGALLEVEGEKE
jgi:Zn-dependent protease with chaperone function